MCVPGHHSGHGPGPPCPHRPQALPLKVAGRWPHTIDTPAESSPCPGTEEAQCCAWSALLGHTDPPLWDLPALPFSPTLVVDLPHRLDAKGCDADVSGPDGMYRAWGSAGRRDKATCVLASRDSSAQSAHYTEGGVQGLMVKLRPARSLFTEGAWRTWPCWWKAMARGRAGC